MIVYTYVNTGFISLVSNVLLYLSTMASHHGDMCMVTTNAQYSPIPK